MEIERKFLIRTIPEGVDLSSDQEFEQSYLSRAPVVRVRREGESFVLTCKSGGMMAREEVNIPISQEDYETLRTMAVLPAIRKTRYRIPDGQYVIELDRFHGELEPLMIAEVEFSSAREAGDYRPPEWFGPEVTFRKEFHNSNLCQKTYHDLLGAIEEEVGCADKGYCGNHIETT